MKFDLFEATILLTRCGSHAYGMATETSDLDVKGVAVPPIGYIAGLDRFEQADSDIHLKDPRFEALWPEYLAKGVEGPIYDYRKFMTLAAQSNPNILDVLFCREEDIVISTPAGRLLRANRDLFLSKKAAHTFSGYAHAQLKRIRNHREWMLRPPPPPATPDRSNAALERDSVLGMVEAQIKAETEKNIDLSYIEDSGLRVIVQNEIERGLERIFLGRGKAEAAREYAMDSLGLTKELRQALEQRRQEQHRVDEYKRYMHWVKSRNPLRAELEQKHSYDTKHGAHALRLMRQGLELLETGQVNVWREDADELLEIRNGAWSYEKLMSQIGDFDLKMAEAAKKSALPWGPDHGRIGELAVEVWRSANDS